MVHWKWTALQRYPSFCIIMPPHWGCRRSLISIEHDASSITAGLESSNDRIRVLSGIQMAGTLAPGENETVQFMAQTELADVGIYPLQLRLNYSRLSKVTAEGVDSAPDLVFSYEEVSFEIPLQVKVIRGPKIELKEVTGEATAGKEATL